MTRKDFERIAKNLSDIDPRKPGQYQDAFQCWVGAVCRLADVCSEDNPRFDRKRFYVACGLDKGADEPVA